MFSLDGKVAVITGAARGIGFGIATAMAAQGATVCLADLNEDVGTESANSLRDEGHAAEFFRCDLSKKAEAYYLIEKVAAKFGRIDILVHNAGAFPFVSIDDLTDDQLDLTLNPSSTISSLIFGVFADVLGVFSVRMAENRGFGLELKV